MAEPQAFKIPPPPPSGPILLPFVDDILSFDKSRLSGLRERRRMAGHVSAAEEASKQRPRQGDELGYEILLQRIRARQVVPFIGAGMSMPLLPSWWQVLEKVAENIGLDLSNCKESAPVITEMLREKIVAEKQRRIRSAHVSKATSDAGNKERPDFGRYAQQQISDCSCLLY